MFDTAGVPACMRVAGCILIACCGIIKLDDAGQPRIKLYK
jgi:hypothetical protein